MIIDMHSHVAGGFSDKFIREWLNRSHFGDMPAWFKDGKESWNAEDFTKHWGDKYIEEMDSKGIDKVVTWGVSILPLDMRSTVEEVAAVARQQPDRIIPFHCGNVMGGFDAVEELEYAVKEHGFRGMKIFPSYNWMDSDDQRIFPLYAKCAELGIPAVVHTGFTFNQGAYLRHHHPEHLDAVCFNFPELKVVAAHFGFQFVEEAMTLMFAHKNLYADLAWFLIYPIDWLARTFAWAKHWGLVERIMYGSDYPLTDPKTEGIDRMREVQAYQERHEIIPVLTDEDIANIMGGNGKRLLGI